MIHTYLSLGSNEGDRLAYLRRGIDLLKESGKIHRLKTSSVYETAPWGYTDQPTFLNLVASGYTTLKPEDLLELCQHIEARSDRERARSVRWGPRTLDIDIITYGDGVRQSDELTIPHPRAHERAFVLIPMIELDSEAKIGDRRARDLFHALPDEQPVKLYSETL